MKAKVKNIRREDDKVVFPVLRKHKTENFIVLFLSPEKRNVFPGIVVSETKQYKLGQYSTAWINPFDEKEWEDFNGEIVLGN